MRKPERLSPGGAVRCAIYTRKSSEDGLEQEFNSLDAQREACQAYIVSQRHASWTVVSDLYDDGGLSGGSMERPALKRLLADITAGRVQIIVVYKVDRLTRSLADFARIVDILDAQKASFVSVTQQFNTTTSMGRLTLNMLLSFAQFEREIAGERIRDKIAASKARGMWMGGNVPLGYDVRERKLVVNAGEAETVRSIFRCYVELGSVRLLRDELDRLGIVSKRREGASGTLAGGKRFSRGALYTLLQNRTYRGDIVHKGVAHKGQQEAIVDEELWERVETRLSAGRQERVLRGGSAPSLLIGLIVDAAGQRLTPTHSNKAGKRYRYYASLPRVNSDGGADSSPARRLPAGEIETLVVNRLRAFLASQKEVTEAVAAMAPDAQVLAAILARSSALAARWPSLAPFELREIVRTMVEEVTVDADRVVLRLTRNALFASPHAGDAALEPLSQHVDAPLLLTTEARLRRSGRGLRMILSEPSPDRVDPGLAALLGEALAAREVLFSGAHESIEAMADTIGARRGHLSALVRLSYLSPQIVGDILEGRQPGDLTRLRLLAFSRNLPLAWPEQRHHLSMSRA